jgi:hypothetical protein
VIPFNVFCIFQRAISIECSIIWIHGNGENCLVVMWHFLWHNSDCTVIKFMLHLPSFKRKHIPVQVRVEQVHTGSQQVTNNTHSVVPNHRLGHGSEPVLMVQTQTPATLVAGPSWVGDDNSLFGSPSPFRRQGQDLLIDPELGDVDDTLTKWMCIFYSALASMSLGQCWLGRPK